VGARRSRYGAVMRARVIDDVEELAALSGPWDELACASNRPYAAPGWLLAWWRCVAPDRAQLRAVAVWEGSSLVALAPYFVVPQRGGFAEYRMMGTGVSHRLALPCRPGNEEAVAHAIVEALRGMQPRMSSIRFEAMDADSAWPELIQGSWHRRPRPYARRDAVLDAPVMSLTHESFEAWMHTRKKKFRDNLKRARRMAAERKATLRMSSTETLEDDLRAFGRLHYQRWDKRGGSNALDPAVEALMLDAAQALVSEGRFRLWILEVQGRAACAQLLVVAGGEAAFWGGGFDPDFGKLSPGIVTLAGAVEDCFHRGEQRLDLGGGAQPYKLRFADGAAPVAWTTLFARDARYPATLARVLPRHIRWRAQAAARRLEPETRRRIMRLIPRRGRE
jgi:CelD/BcsL family acetyltransferase involved in cellulose biosynthesis